MAVTVTAAVDGGGWRWHLLLMAGGNGKSGGGQWRRSEMIIISNAGVCFVLSSFILLYLGEASKSWEQFQDVARKSPGSPQEVPRKSPGSPQEGPDSIVK